MRRLIVVLGTVAVATALAASPAAAYLVSIDDLTVVKNGGTVLDDAFAGGAAPPDGPDGASTYGVGSGATFTEADGVATMSTATGGSSVFGGVDFIRHTAIFLTNTQPLSVSKLGLKSDDTFSVAGLFDVFIPTANRESYGVMLSDRLGPGGSVNTGNDELDMRVVRTAVGQLALQFARVNYVTQETSPIQGISLLTAVGEAVLADVTGDQILLRLAKGAEASNAITASYEYFDNGLSLGLQTFSNTGTIFNNDAFDGTGDASGGEDWTRAGFFAREAVSVSVPEPATFALLGVGLAALGVGRRRRAA